MKYLIMFLLIAASQSWASSIDGMYAPKKVQTSLSCFTSGVLWKHDPIYDEIMDLEEVQIKSKRNGDIVVVTDIFEYEFTSPSEAIPHYFLYIGKRRNLTITPRNSYLEISYQRGSSCQYSGILEKIN